MSLRPCVSFFVLFAVSMALFACGKQIQGDSPQPARSFEARADFDYQPKSAEFLVRCQPNDWRVDFEDFRPGIAGHENKRNLFVEVRGQPVAGVTSYRLLAVPGVKRWSSAGGNFGALQLSLFYWAMDDGVYQARREIRAAVVSFPTFSLVPGNAEAVEIDVHFTDGTSIHAAASGNGAPEASCAGLYPPSTQ